ncbi:MAG: transposase [Thermoanaerobaculia bacterium]
MSPSTIHAGMFNGVFKSADAGAYWFAAMAGLPESGVCDLSRAAWETVRAMMAEAAADPGVRPGMVVVPQTFGSSVNAHPHVHAIASRGGWTKEGTWVPSLTSVRARRRGCSVTRCCGCCSTRS